MVVFPSMESDGVKNEIKKLFLTPFYSGIFKNIRKKKLFFRTFRRVLSYGHTQKMIFPRFGNLEKLSEFNLSIWQALSAAPESSASQYGFNIVYIYRII